MVVVMESHDAEDIFIFVDRFAEVPSLLLEMPVAVWVAVLSLCCRRVDVTAILRTSAAAVPLRYSRRTISGSNSTVSIGLSEASRRCWNWGRAATAGTRARVSGRAATMRRESML